MGNGELGASLYASTVDFSSLILFPIPIPHSPFLIPIRPPPNPLQLEEVSSLSRHQNVDRFQHVDAPRGITCWIMFPYERWKVYRLALELRDVANELSGVQVRYASHDLDHLRRCSSSALFNIGEGALRRNKGEKLQFYNIALGSVGECNAVLTVLAKMHPNKQLVQHGRDLCQHIAALLTNLIASVMEKYK